MCEKTKNYNISGGNIKTPFGDIREDFKKDVETTYTRCPYCGKAECDEDCPAWN